MSVNTQIRDFVSQQADQQADNYDIISLIANEFFIVEASSSVERLAKFKLSEEALQGLMESRSISIAKFEKLPHHCEAVLRTKVPLNGFEIPFTGKIVPGMRCDISDGRRHKTVKVSSINSEVIKTEEPVNFDPGATIVVRSDSKVCETTITTCRGCGHTKRVSVFPQGLGVCQDCYKDIREKQRQVFSYITGELSRESYFTTLKRKPVIIPMSRAHVMRVENLGDKKPVFFVEYEGRELKMRQGKGVYVEIINSRRIPSDAVEQCKAVGETAEGQIVYEIDGENYILITPRHIRGLAERSDPKNLRIKREATPCVFDGKWLDIDTRGDSCLEHMVRIFNISRSLKYANAAPISPEGVEELYEIFTRQGGERQVSRTMCAVLNKKVQICASRLLNNADVTQEWVHKLVTVKTALDSFEAMSR